MEGGGTPNGINNASARAQGEALHARQSDTRKSQRRVSLVFLVRLTLGLIFLAACADKIVHPAAFAKVLRNYQLLPNPLIAPVAVILPWLEALLGLALVTGRCLPGAVLLSTLLLASFLAALLLNLARGLNVHCGCFSSTVTKDPDTLQTVARDVLFLGLAAILCWNTFFLPRSPHDRNKK